MKVLLLSATPFEIAPILHKLEHEGANPNVELQVLIGGIGLNATAFALGRHLATEKPDWVLQTGIAGSFDPEYPPGSVVQVVSETFADLGVEEADGRITDLFELDLLQADNPPFRAGRLWNDEASKYPFLPAVHALSVNKVSGAAHSIAGLKKRYPHAQIETMEGAACFYACLLAEVPFTQVRGISNFVEPRNRNNWKIREAIQAVNEVAGIMVGIWGSA